MKAKWNNFKSLVASLIVWAESELKGKSGAEKQAAVVNMICDKFPWPFPLRLFQRPILSVVVGWVSAKIVAALNVVTDHDFAGLVADPDEIVAASEMPRQALASAQDIESVEDRFKALCEEYGVESDESIKPVTTPKSYFKRSEFTCKDGCGTNKVQQELIDMLNVIRDAFGRPVTVTSGTRCVANNAKAGGATNSNHLTGHAADIRCTDRSMTPAQMYDVVMDLYRAGKIPQLAGISKNYDSIIHVDVHPHREDGKLRTW